MRDVHLVVLSQRQKTRCSFGHSKMQPQQRSVEDLQVMQALLFKDIIVSVSPCGFLGLKRNLLLVMS